MAGKNDTFEPLTAVTFTHWVKGREENQSVQPPPSMVGAFLGALIHIRRPAVRPLGELANASVDEPRVAPLLTLTVVYKLDAEKSQLLD